MSIHAHFDRAGALTQTEHFLYDDPHLWIAADANTGSSNGATVVWLRIGTATTYLTPIQGETVLAELAKAVSKAATIQLAAAPQLSAVSP